MQKDDSMKNKQALVKLAQIKLAINYVLRNRQMTKQATKWEDMEDNSATRYYLHDLFQELPIAEYEGIPTDEKGLQERQKRIDNWKLQQLEDSEMPPQQRFTQEYYKQFPNRQLFNPDESSLKSPSDEAPLNIIPDGPPYIHQDSLIYHPEDRLTELLTPKNVYSRQNPYWYKQFKPEDKGVRGYADRLSSYLFGVPTVDTMNEDLMQDFAKKDVRDFENYMKQPYQQVVQDDTAYGQSVMDQWLPNQPVQLDRRGEPDISDREFETRHYNKDNKSIDWESDDPFRRLKPIPRDTLQATAVFNNLANQVRKRREVGFDAFQDIERQKRDYFWNEAKPGNSFEQYFGKRPVDFRAVENPAWRNSLAHSYIAKTPFGRFAKKYSYLPGVSTLNTGYHTLFNMLDSIQNSKDTPKPAPVNRFKYTSGPGVFESETTVDNLGKPQDYYNPQYTPKELGIER